MSGLKIAWLFSHYRHTSPLAVYTAQVLIGCTKRPSLSTSSTKQEPMNEKHECNVS